MNIFEKLVSLEHEASEYGFRWENADQVLSQIESECTEISEHIYKTNNNDKLKLQEEIGDLLHAAFSLCVFLKFNPQKTLENSVDKFEHRFRILQSLANAEGIKNLEGRSFKELMDFWDRAKQITQKTP